MYRLVLSSFQNVPSIAINKSTFRGKLRNALDFEILELQYHISKSTCHRLFWSTALVHFRCSNLNLRIWSKDVITLDEKNAVYERLGQVCPYYNFMASKIADPWAEIFGYNRKCLIVLIDSTTSNPIS